MSEQDKNSNPPKNPPPAPKEKPQNSGQQDPHTRPVQLLKNSKNPDDRHKTNK